MAKPSEIPAKQEAENNTAIANITTTQNETIAKTQAANKTDEQITAVEDKIQHKKSISDFFDKMSLIFVAVIFIIIIAVPVIIYDIKKRKKEKDKLTNTAEQNQNIFKPNI